MFSLGSLHVNYMFVLYLVIDFHAQKVRSSASFLKLRISSKQLNRIVNGECN